MTRSYLEMYENGPESEQAVWQQLIALGDLEEGTALWEDAYSVARATMWRARRKVERIIAFLEASGYRFHSPAYLPDDAPWRPPTPETPAQVQQLIALIGP